MEICEAVLPLDFVHSKLDLPERMIFVLLQVGKRDLEYPSLQSVIGILETGGSVDERFSDTGLVSLEG